MLHFSSFWSTVTKRFAYFSDFFHWERGGCLPFLVAVACFPRWRRWPTFTRLPSPLCSLHTSRGCNLRLTERKPKGSDRVVTRSVHIGSLNEQTHRRSLLSSSVSVSISLQYLVHLSLIYPQCFTVLISRDCNIRLIYPVIHRINLLISRDKILLRHSWSIN